ncbi:MAG: anti-sigma regulatory factor [Paludibacter sp.]|jgi:serine/threonine-protein kinase RsbT|nr:anti-sigma regulatory factor [Paludibacter sp.]
MIELTSDPGWEMLEELTLETEFDIVKARQSVRQFAKDAGMGIVDQTRITTAVSELFRNMYMYAGGGIIRIQRGPYNNHNSLIITCIDKGPGIDNLELAMQDGYTSGQGMGYGLPGAKRLVDDFEIQSEPGKGTTVRVVKWK